MVSVLEAAAMTGNACFNTVCQSTYVVCVCVCCSPESTHIGKKLTNTIIVSFAMSMSPHIQCVAQEQLFWDTIPSARAHKDSSIKPGFLDKVSQDENVLPAFKSEPQGPLC